MYLPEHFKESDLEAVRRMVRSAPLCTLVAHTRSGLVANHLPVLFENERLVGHIAMANDLHEVLDIDAPVLCIFQAGDTYVSPNWYPSKARHHRHVPTWNYRVVHLHGKIRFLHEESAKRAVVARLTRIHEEATNGADAWRMRDAPRDYIDDMLGAIVAFEVLVTRVEAKAKLSQNRESEDLDGVIRALDDRGDHDLAAAMRAARDAGEEAMPED